MPGDGRRKRGTARHAGIYLKRRALPSGGVAWRARFRDPDTGKVAYETLPAHASRTDESRAAWAVERARRLAQREQALAHGAAAKTGRTLADTVEEYFRLNEARLRPATVAAYRLGAAALLAWATERRVEKADDLRGQDLEAFRAWTFARPRAVQAAGEGVGRGARVVGGTSRSAVSVNSRLRAVKTILDALRRLGLFPLLTHDHIRDSLRAEREPRPLPVFLTQQKIRALLRAALRHDGDRCALTRAEKAAGLDGGATPRHEPISPFVTFCLLSGLRFEEARTLRWESVDLAAPPAGTLHVGVESKTGHARLVDLSVSPALRSLLAALRLRSGGAPFVFGGDEPRTRSQLEKARKRLTKADAVPAKAKGKRRPAPQGGYGAPDFDWQALRSTCGTYLANAAGIFGGASAYREARQLGHSVAVAERHYLGVVHVDREATTLDAALGVQDLLDAVVAVASGRSGAPGVDLDAPARGASVAVS